MDTKKKIIAIAVLAAMISASLTGCGKKATTDSSSVAETTTTATTAAESVAEDTSSVEEEEELPSELADAQGYQMIQMAASNIKAEGSDMTGFRANVTVKGTFTPKTEIAVEAPAATDSADSTADTTSSEAETVATTEIEWGDPEDIEAYYTVDVMQSGAHLKGVQFVGDKTRKLEAYYVPSSTETTVYYQCNESGIWHRYSSYNEFVIPTYVDSIRDNAKTHFVNASVDSTPDDYTDEYVVSSKITDDRLTYVGAALFESLFFTEYYEQDVSGTTTFTISDDAIIKNISLALKSEQLEMNVSADVYNYNSLYSVTAPAEAFDAGLFDFQANGAKFWIDDEKSVIDVEEGEEGSEETASKESAVTPEVTDSAEDDEKTETEDKGTDTEADKKEKSNEKE